MVSIVAALLMLRRVAGCRQPIIRDCYTFDCVDNKKIDYCGLCEDFPCNEIMTRKGDSFSYDVCSGRNPKEMVVEYK